MSNVVEVWAWGEDWSPITIVASGTVMTLVYYPHKATADVIMTMKGLPVHCMVCDAEVKGTRPHTGHKYISRAIVTHLKSHGRRTKKRNRFLLSLEESRRVG